MAWRSSGTTNDEMVDKLKSYGVISSMAVEEGFRSVDRKHFVPQDNLHVAHSDLPLREGSVHISAPHMYGSVLEALELRQNSALSFLNAGSGTGYLSAIVATILGSPSSHYCVEIHEEAVQHCRESMERWKLHHPPAREIQHIEIIRGNALQIAVDQGEAMLGFDRIYVGASIDKSGLAQMKKMLKPGGVLVAPVDDELVKVVRSPGNPTMPANYHQEFDEQILSPVRFTAMTKHPALVTIIPSRVWNSSIHRYYPENFRLATKEILMCSNARYEQPVQPQPAPNVLQVQVNIAAMLPRVLWMEIMAYTHRDWFEAPQSELMVLRRRLAEEQANSQRANTRRLEAESRCHIVERERDVYRLLARRWQSRLDSLLNQRGGGGDSVLSESESVADAAASNLLLGGREQAAIFGFERIFRRFSNRSASYESSEDDDDEDDDHDEDIEVSEENEARLMEEDIDAMNEDMFDDDTDGSLSSTGNELPVERAGSSVAQQMAMSAETAKVIASRPQVRTVSISGPDL